MYKLGSEIFHFMHTVNHLLQAFSYVMFCTTVDNVSSNIVCRAVHLR